MTGAPQMVSPSTTSVLVVGAGPVGLTLALLLDQAGIDVTLIDRDTAPVEQSRAIWVHSRTLEVWDTIGMTKLALAEGRAIYGIQMRTGGTPRATLPYDGTGTTAYPHALMIEQSRTQSLLLSLVEKSRIVFSWDTSLVGFSQDDTRCHAELSTGAGHNSSVEASFVIGADGGSSTVRQLLDIEFQGGTHNSSFFLADVIAHADLDPSMSYLNFQGRSTVAVLPLPGEGHFRLIGNLTDQSQEKSEAGYGRTLSNEEVRRLIEANSLPVTIESIGWSSTYRTHHRVASTFRLGRAVLVGDAGHLHSPAGGLGMNTGVADAANLAFKIAGMLDGAPERLLDSYIEERRFAALQVVNTSDRLFVLQADVRRRYAFVRNRILPHVVRLITRMPAGKRVAFRILSGTSVHYPHIGVEGPRYGRLQTGRLLPFSGNPAIDENPAIKKGKHLLLTIGVSEENRLGITALAQSRGWPVVSVSAGDGRLLTGRNHGPLVAWVRPDRYVGWIGRPTEELSMVLEKWLGSANASTT